MDEARIAISYSKKLFQSGSRGLGIWNTGTSLISIARDPEAVGCNRRRTCLGLCWLWLWLWLWLVSVVVIMAFIIVNAKVLRPVTIVLYSTVTCG